MDIVGNGSRLCILGYLNRWIEDRTRASITGAFGVPGENDNIMIEEWWSFAKKGDSVWETHVLRRMGSGLSDLCCTV